LTDVEALAGRSLGALIIRKRKKNKKYDVIKKVDDVIRQLRRRDEKIGSYIRKYVYT